MSSKKVVQTAYQNLYNCLQGTNYIMQTLISAGQAEYNRSIFTLVMSSQYSIVVAAGTVSSLTYLNKG